MSVLISGATGFIAQYIVDDLLKQGYEVIGTVRSQEKAGELLKQFDNNPNLALEVVPDMAAPNAFDMVFEKHGANVKVVLHTASPFFYESKDYEKDLLLPAVNGTKSILGSIKKFAAKSVERVVLTSSFVAMMDLSKVNDGSFVYTEKSWNPSAWENCQVGGFSAYSGSKKFAEEAAWEFLRDNRHDVKFQMTTVNPALVFGPQLFDENIKDTLNTSCESINALILNKPEAKLMENLQSYYVDVRDVSKAHLIAFQREEAIGKRLLLCDGSFVYQDLEDILNEDFSQLKGKILIGNPGSGKKIHKTFPSVDNTETKSILGFPFRSLKETVHDTAVQILNKHGII